MGRTTLRAIIVGGLLLIGCEASQTMTDTSPAADADVPPVNEVLAPADAPQDSGPAPGADDDGDGYPNAMEERFGSDPQDASSRPPDLDGDLIPDDDDPDRETPPEESGGCGGGRSGLWLLPLLVLLRPTRESPAAP